MATWLATCAVALMAFPVQAPAAEPAPEAKAAAAPLRIGMIGLDTSHCLEFTSVPWFSSLGSPSREPLPTRIVPALTPPLNHGSRPVLDSKKIIEPLVNVQSPSLRQPRQPVLLPGAAQSNRIIAASCRVVPLLTRPTSA